MVKILDSNSRDLGCTAGRINVDKRLNIFFYRSPSVKWEQTMLLSFTNLEREFCPWISLQQAAMHNPLHR